MYLKNDKIYEKTEFQRYDFNYFIESPKKIMLCRNLV